MSNEKAQVFLEQAAQLAQVFKQTRCPTLHVETGEGTVTVRDDGRYVTVSANREGFRIEGNVNVEINGGWVVTGFAGIFVERAFKLVAQKQKKFPL